MQANVQTLCILAEIVYIGKSNRNIRKYNQTLHSNIIRTQTVHAEGSILYKANVANKDLNSLETDFTVITHRVS